MVNHVDGEGVVGEQPLLTPGKSHDYVSGCPLATPFGSMEGFYTFERADGSRAEVRIPFFPLTAPETAEGRTPR
jgi:ApaG protein